MHTLLERSARMPHHTDLATVFRAIGGAQRAYEWLLTDLEVRGEWTPARAPLFEADGSSVLRIGGDALTAVVEEGGFLQVDCGVLSAFEPGHAPDPAALDPVPYADGNASLWQPGVTLQHPAARVEIVCFDSSATLLLSREPAITARFRAWFPEAVDLERHNVAASRTSRTH